MNAPSAYVPVVDWQQVISLLIVATAAALLARGWWRRRKRRFDGAACGCPPANPDAPSIVFHARKGQRPEIHVKSARSKTERA